jgi:hypothetical protein
MGADGKEVNINVVYLSVYDPRQRHEASSTPNTIQQPTWGSIDRKYQYTCTGIGGPKEYIRDFPKYKS